MVFCGVDEYLAIHSDHHWTSVWIFSVQKKKNEKISSHSFKVFTQNKHTIENRFYSFSTSTHAIIQLQTLILNNKTPDSILFNNYTTLL